MNRNHVDPKLFIDKSLSELQKSLKAAEEFVKQHPQFEFGWHNEYLQQLKMHIAEKIGK